MKDLVARAEHLIKKPVWGCEMCGQCVLHSTGLTCPMTCPKTLRNGPCGGVRANGNREVKPEMRCVWLKAYERSERLPMWRGQIDDLRPPVDNTLKISFRRDAGIAKLCTRLGIPPRVERETHGHSASLAV